MEAYAFSATVPGFLHIRKGTPCQDASAHVEGTTADGRPWAVAVVSDGHGDHTCVRSDRGAAIAVRVGADALSEFACKSESSRIGEGQSLADELLIETHVPMIVVSLTNSLLARWQEEVLGDANADPFSEEELARAGEMGDDYLEGKHLEHAYGATFLAALCLPDVLLLLQQGDGRCILLGADGACTQPVPWDERCHENVTTSLSDADAFSSVRHAVLDLREGNPSMLFLCSDGVEDSFRTMGGTEAYLSGLAAHAIDGGSREAFESYLQDELPRLSEAGSGDDTSVAGYVWEEVLRAQRDAFARRSSDYERAERRRAMEQALQSMGYKLQILEKRHALLREHLEELNQGLTCSDYSVDERNELRESLEFEMRALGLEEYQARRDALIEELEELDRADARME